MEAHDIFTNKKFERQEKQEVEIEVVRTGGKG